MYIYIYIYICIVVLLGSCCQVYHDGTDAWDLVVVIAAAAAAAAAAAVILSGLRCFCLGSPDNLFQHFESISVTPVFQITMPHGSCAELAVAVVSCHFMQLYQYSLI